MWQAVTKTSAKILLFCFSCIVIGGAEPRYTALMMVAENVCMNIGKTVTFRALAANRSAQRIFMAQGDWACLMFICVGSAGKWCLNQGTKMIYLYRVLLLNDKFLVQLPADKPHAHAHPAQWWFIVEHYLYVLCILIMVTGQLYGRAIVRAHFTWIQWETVDLCAGGRLLFSRSFFYFYSPAVITFRGSISRAI